MNKKIISLIIVISTLFLNLTNTSYSSELNIIKNEINTNLNIDLFQNNINKELKVSFTDFYYTENNKNIQNKEFNPFFVNFIIPGFTQIYYGEQERGFLFLFGSILALVIPYSIRSFSRSMGEVIILFLLEISLAPIIYIWSLVDAKYLIDLHKESLENQNLFNITFLSKEF